jgi:hypothetical protein
MLTVAHAMEALKESDPETYSLSKGFETDTALPITLEVTTSSEGSGYMSYEVGVLEVDIAEGHTNPGWGIYFTTTAASNNFLKRLMAL